MTGCLAQAIFKTDIRDEGRAPFSRTLASHYS